MEHRVKKSFILCVVFLVLLAAACSPAEATHTFSSPGEHQALPLSTPTTVVASTAPAPFIYDDDGSVDGTLALLYLLDFPRYPIQSINISYGEAHPAVYIQHLGAMLETLGIQGIPLGAGQDAPLAPATPFPDFLRAMSDSFWQYPLPGGKTYPVENAPELIVRTIQDAGSTVIVFESGPFTSLAQALRLDPTIKSKISAVYFMGGAVDVRGNITNLIPDSPNLVAEWNIFADPLAAKEVFESGLDLFMVPLDATNPLTFTEADLAPWRTGSPRGKLAADLYNVFFHQWNLPQVEIFDLYAAVLSVKPGLCPFQPMHLDVVTAAGDTLGQTAVQQYGDPNVRVCLTPDLAGMRQEINRVFSQQAEAISTP